MERGGLQASCRLRERATRLTTHFDGSGVLRRWEAASPRSMRQTPNGRWMD